MNFEIIPVSYDEKQILSNLLEKYNYEFSQYDERDVNDFGLYGYKYLDNYWTENRRHAFFIKVNKKLAGFVMVRKLDEADKNTYSISEFFIMYKYRRLGLGRYSAYKMFDMFKGDWGFFYHKKNETSKHFWHNIVNEYTNGNYKLIKSDDSDNDILKFKS